MPLLSGCPTCRPLVFYDILARFGGGESILRRLIFSRFFNLHCKQAFIFSDCFRCKIRHLLSCLIRAVLP